jgi:hypothetical protein
MLLVDRRPFVNGSLVDRGRLVDDGSSINGGTLISDRPLINRRSLVDDGSRGIAGDLRLCARRGPVDRRARVGPALLGGSWNDRAESIRRFRTAAGLLQVDLAGWVFGPFGRMSRRPDLGVGVDVDHPVLDQLRSPVFLWSRRDPDPGMRSAAQ